MPGNIEHFAKPGQVFVVDTGDAANGKQRRRNLGKKQQDILKDL